MSHGVKQSTRDSDLEKIPYIVAAFVLEALPFAVPMELYMVAVSLACGILGEIIVFKERIAKISENEPSATGQSS